MNFHEARRISLEELRHKYGQNSNDGQRYTGWRRPMTRRAARLIARKLARKALRGE
jgi:hypothetical protein